MRLPRRLAAKQPFRPFGSRPLIRIPGPLAQPAAAVRCRASSSEDEEPQEAAVELQAVDKIVSAQLMFQDDGKPAVRYLTRWKARACLPAHPAQLAPCEARPAPRW